LQQYLVNDFETHYVHISNELIRFIDTNPHRAYCHPMSRRLKARGPFLKLANALEGKYFAWILLVPSLFMVTFFIFYPVYRGIYLSFTRTKLLEGPGSTFIGLSNFKEMLGDPLFLTATKNTLLFMAIGLITQLSLGLVAAILLSQDRKFIGLIRVLVVLPWFTPPVVTAYMWRFILDSNSGVLIKLLEAVGINFGPAGIWGNPHLAIYAVLFVDLWASYPFFMLFLLAAIQGIPKDMRESTSVDGASSWQHFRFVMLPLIKPVVAVSSVLGVIQLINSPTLMLLMTNGGPGDSTLVLLLYASTISVAVLVAIAGFAMVYIRFVRFGKEE
jgi:multiple sugar transport system permease protein